MYYSSMVYIIVPQDFAIVSQPKSILSDSSSKFEENVLHLKPQRPIIVEILKSENLSHTGTMIIDWISVLNGNKFEYFLSLRLNTLQT